MQKKSSRKTKKTTPEYDSQREQNVLINDIYKAVQTVAEQVTTMKEEIIAKVDTEVGEVKSELDTVKMAVMENSANIKVLKRDVSQIKVRLDKNLDNHEKRITRLEGKVSV